MTPQVIDPGDPPPLRVIQTGDIDIFSDVHWIQPGRFSDVLYGFSHSFAENVALKRLRNQDDGKFSERDLRLFNEEASIWHTLEHPHVLPLRGVYLCQSGFTYLVSPYMDNGDLMNYLKSNPTADRRPLLTDIASAIAYLHSLSIIHGDIKARNILVSATGSAQLCDFGLSKHSSWTTSEGRKGAGTIRWQSPELLFDEPKSFKSDVYAFGITIFEVLSGEIPFGSSSDGAIVYGVVLRNARPPCLPKFDESGRSYADVWAVARECWHRVAGSRPEMREVWRKLEMQVIREKTVHAMVLADEDDVLATPSGPGPPLARVSTTPEVISADDDEVEETNELSARRHTIDIPLNLSPTSLEEEEEEEPEFLFTPPDSPLLGATAGPVIGGGLLPLDSANFALEEQEQDVEEQGEEQGIGRVPMMATMDKVAEDRLGREQLQQQLGGGSPRQGYGGDNRRSDDSSSSGGVGGSDDANRGFAYYDSLISSFGSLGKGELGKTITLDHHEHPQEEQTETIITKSIPTFISPKSSIDWANWSGGEASDNCSTRTGTTRKRTTNYLF